MCFHFSSHILYPLPQNPCSGSTAWWSFQDNEEISGQVILATIKWYTDLNLTEGKIKITKRSWP
uniref:Uncharacterized protein n=1 Tax=Anguilla anguilla TaxID=7936 RepID=A0A0E9WMQ0_ANGAN